MRSLIGKIAEEREMMKMGGILLIYHSKLKSNTQ